MTKMNLTLGVGVAVVLIGALAWWSGIQDGGMSATPPKNGEKDKLAEPAAPAETKTPSEALAHAREVPAAERVLVPAAEMLPGALYVVLDPGGRTVPHAQLALCAGGEVLAAGTTDESGTFETQLSCDEEARLLVSAEGFAPQVHKVPTTAARHEVVLTEGEVISGWVVVDGHAPEEPISMRLVADRDSVDPVKDLGVEWDALSVSAPVLLRTMTHTAAAGTFQFAGLPAGWSGRIDLPSEYRLRDQMDAASDIRLSSVRLERAVAGLRIDVVRHFVLTGRVVETSDGTAERVPVANVLVEPDLIYADGVGRMPFQGTEHTDENGRFRIPLLALSIRGGFLTLQPQDGGFRRNIAIEPLELTGNHDLGDLALLDREGKVTLPLLVQAMTGEPIGGAVAGTDVESPISEPTDEGGHTSLGGVTPGESTIVVYASGWEVTMVDVPGELANELVVTMRRAAMLELRFRQPNGKSAADVVSRLWADMHPYRDEAPIALLGGYRAAGCTRYRTALPGDGTVVVRLSADREGRAVVNDVRPGVALHLRVEGRFGATVLEKDLAPLAPAEWRVVEVDLPRGPLTLHGRVVDQAGAPVPSAGYIVSFIAPDSPAGFTMSSGDGVDENGEFYVRDIYQSHIQLSVDADGYVEFRDWEFEVPLDEEPVEFVIFAGGIVTVILQDEARHPVEGDVASFLPGGAYASGRAVVDQPGTYLLRGVPTHEVEIRATVHGVVYKQKHDPRVSTLTFTIPTYEDVTVGLVSLGTGMLDGQCFLRLLPLDDANPYPRYQPLAPGFSGSLTIESVAPGRYEAVVSRYFNGDDGQAQFEDLCPRVPFDVSADEPTSVTVEF